MGFNLFGVGAVILQRRFSLRFVSLRIFLIFFERDIHRFPRRVHSEHNIIAIAPVMAQRDGESVFVRFRIVRRIQCLHDDHLQLLDLADDRRSPPQQFASGRGREIEHDFLSGTV